MPILWDAEYIKKNKRIIDMKHWFETLKEARAVAKDRNAESHNGRIHVFKWKFTKRKRPFYVGTELEWLNVG